MVCFMAHSTNSILYVLRGIEGKDEQLLGRREGGIRLIGYFFFPRLFDLCVAYGGNEERKLKIARYV